MGKRGLFVRPSVALAPGSLRQRIQAAASGDLIQFASSLAGATLTLTITNALPGANCRTGVRSP